MAESLEEMAAGCVSHHNACACVALASARNLVRGRRAVAHLRELVLSWTAVQLHPSNRGAQQALRSEMQQAVGFLEDLDILDRTL